MYILAIDPGFERIGIAILEKDSFKKESIIYSNCFKTPSTLIFPKRLEMIGLEIEKVIKKYKPKALAIEKLYMTTNQKTVMNVAEVRGMIIYLATKNKLDIYEYSPPQIKLAITGYGKASKEMILSMLGKLIKLDPKIKSDDELDAIAIGLTCFACERRLSRTLNLL
jgi:crossover junction endodeoxyribonuclease RuvC